jgi:hypothetical protein
LNNSISGSVFQESLKYGFSESVLKSGIKNQLFWVNCALSGSLRRSFGPSEFSAINPDAMHNHG